MWLILFLAPQVVVVVLLVLAVVAVVAGGMLFHPGFNNMGSIFKYYEYFKQNKSKYVFCLKKPHITADSNTDWCSL